MAIGASIEWHGTDTAIQTIGIARDFGVLDGPDSCYRRGNNFSGLRSWVFRHFMRPGMNRRVAAIRGRS
jgi:hypothetical protein